MRGANSKPERVKQRKDMIGEPGRVGVVLFDSQLGFVIEQPVEYVRGIAHIGVDDLGIERRVLVGKVRVEQDAGLAAVFGVLVAADSRGRRRESADHPTTM